MVRSDFADRISRDLHHDGNEPADGAAPVATGDAATTAKVV
jgi:hypothetical protein